MAKDESSRESRFPQSQEWWSTTLKSIADAVVATDRKGLVTFMNSAAEALLEWNSEATLGGDLSAFFKIINRDTRQPVENPVTKVLRDGSVANLADHTLLVTRSGREIPIDDRAAPIRDNKGNITGVVLVFRDITERDRAEREREKAEKALFQAKKEWERTFDTIPDLIAILDKGYRIVRVNRAMAERLSLTPDQCIGVQCHQVIHGIACPPDFCPHALTCRDGREHMAEVHEAVLGGDFLVSTTPLHDDRGQLVGSIHVARDITERKRMENEIREKSKNLEDANRELESFSYSVSHDLRAPLRGIDGYTRMLSRSAGERLDEDDRKKILVIREQVARMGQLIDDLLAFSRFGRAALSPSLLDMEALVNQVWEELCRINPGRCMTLSNGPLPAAWGDRALIRQLLANLLSNAVKFTRNVEKAVIEVGGDLQGKECHYYVKDNGTGFDMQYYDKLFGVFQRLHSDAAFEGTGVGLAIVQRIVHRHGGRVWAEGEVGKGATFSFTLPGRQG